MYCLENKTVTSRKPVTRFVPNKKQDTWAKKELARRKKLNKGGLKCLPK